MLKILFGDSVTADAKVAFRKSLSRLAKETISEQDPFWSTFWLTLDSPSEATVLISADDIREAIQTRPQNIATLIRVVSQHVIELAADSAFPTDLSSGSSWSFSRATSSKAETSKEMLNCVRVLTRVFPIIYETLVDSNDRWFEKLMWQSTVISSSYAEGRQFVIDSDEEEGDISSDSQSQSPPLAQTLLLTILNLLFNLNFTLPINADEGASSKVQYIIWEPGIGSSAAIPATKSHEACRTELLRLILALLSVNVYSPAAPNRMFDYLTTSIPRKIVLTLLCSLLNTALARPQATTMLDPSETLSRLSTLALGSDPKQTDELAKSLPVVCFQVLDILLIPQDLDMEGITSPPVSPVRERAASVPLSEVGDTSNMFIYYCSRLHRKNDLSFLWESLSTLVQKPAGPSVSLLSGNTLNVGVTEGVILLWRLLECNRSFLQFLMDQERSPTLLVLLLNIAMDCKNQPASFGLVRLCAYTLQTLSAERSFASQFNTPIERIASARKYNVVPNGRVNDYLITTVYSLIFTSDSAFSALYPAFILTIANCSAYMKALSVTASTKFVQFFLAFSAPAFLLAEDGNPRLVYYLIEGFNNIIYHQMSDNANLIYAIVRSHRRFENLASFTLKGAVDEIRRVRSERRSTLSGVSMMEAGTESPTRPSLKSNTSATSLLSLNSLPGEDKYNDDEEDPVRMSEKARGKMRERSVSLGERPGEDADPGHPGPYMSRTGFVPTEGWVSSWREHMPLDTILLLLSELQPKVTSLCSVASKSTNKAVFDYLSSVSLSDILPPAPPLKPRRFQHSPYSRRWLTALTWGLVYLANPQIYAHTRISLFSVQAATTRDVVGEATQAISKVSSAVMERLPSASAVTGQRTPQRVASGANV